MSNPIRIGLISGLAIGAGFAAAYGVNVFGPKLWPELAHNSSLLRVTRYIVAVMAIVSVKLVLGGYRPATFANDEQQVGSYR